MNFVTECFELFNNRHNTPLKLTAPNAPSLQIFLFRPQQSPFAYPKIPSAAVTSIISSQRSFEMPNAP